MPSFQSLTVDLNKQKRCFSIEGDSEFGANHVLLLQDDDLTAGLNWHKQGYTIAAAFNATQFEVVQLGISRLLEKLVKKETLVHFEEFELSRYHQYVTDESIHEKVVNQFRTGFSFEQFPIEMDMLIDRVSEVCKKPLSLEHPIGAFGKGFTIRIVRPKSNDANPLHRDVWLDRLRSAINLYIPIVGSDGNSTLGLIPESHLWPEDEIAKTLAGATVNGRSYTVPAVAGAKRSLSVSYPNPQPGQMLVFSPYLIHGCGLNFNSLTTRVSLEIRLWRRKRSI